MYGWMWRHLPGPWPARAVLVLVIAAGIVFLLFTQVFPWAEHSLPFLEVTVDS